MIIKPKKSMITILCEFKMQKARFKLINRAFSTNKPRRLFVNVVFIFPFGQYFFQGDRFVVFIFF